MCITTSQPYAWLGQLTRSALHCCHLEPFVGDMAAVGGGGIKLWTRGREPTGYKSSQSCKYTIMYLPPCQISIIYSIVSNGSFENITAITSKALLSVFLVCGSLKCLNPTVPLEHPPTARPCGWGQLRELESHRVHLTCGSTTATVLREKGLLMIKRFKWDFSTVITHF